MRIAHVTDFYLPRLGGIELQVADLAARQAALGHDVTVITSSPGEPAAPGGPVVVRLGQDLRRPAAMHPAAALSVGPVLRAGGFDVVHVHVGVCSPLGFWAARTAARAGIPTVVTVHSFWAWVYPVFRMLDLLGRFSRLPIRWTAVSEAATGPVRRIVRGEGAVAVLPNGIDPQRWGLERQERDPDEVVLVAVMRLSLRKRPLPLLRMVRQVRRRLPAGVRLRLVVAGDGPKKAAMARYLRRHAMTGEVTLAGRQTREQIRELYRRADIFVAPADLESFGIAALEARCAGVPVVAKAGSGITEFVRDGRDGLVAASDAEMVDALVRLCSSPPERAAMAGRPGTGPISWADSLRRTEAAYREAAALAGRPAVPARRG